MSSLTTARIIDVNSYNSVNKISVGFCELIFSPLMNLVNPHPSSNLFVSLCYKVSSVSFSLSCWHSSAPLFYRTVSFNNVDAHIVITVVIVSISPHVQNKCPVSTSTATTFNSCLFPLPGWERGTSDQTHTTNCCLNVKEHRQALWLWSHVSVLVTLRCPERWIHRNSLRCYLW